MDQQLLYNIWNWLPVFRAVAETEHLPSAARRLHVTTPALSRTIRLLEDHMGQELFNRSGRSLVLNSAGQRLLDSVQQAMRELDTALTDITSDPFSGPIRISAIGVLTNHFVLPALMALQRQHPALIPIINNLRTAEANDALAAGHLDCAFYYETVTREGLHIERIGQTTASVYCGTAHPLFEAGPVSLDDLSTHPFSVPAIGDSGQIMDGWPVDLDRTVGMRITLLTTNLEICLGGRFLTVLPDVTAHPHVLDGRLRRFDFDIIPPIAVYAARRRREGAESTAVAVIEAVARCVSETTEEIAGLRA